MTLPTSLITYLPSLAIVGIIATFWNQSRNFVTKVFRIFWKVRNIQERDLANFLYKDLYDNYKVLNFDDFDINNFQIFSLRHRKYLPGFFKLYKIEIFLYKGFIPIFVSGANGGIKISYLKYTFDFESFFSKSIEKFYGSYCQELEKEPSRFYVEEIRGRSLKSISMSSKENKDSTINVSISPQTESSQSTSYHTLYPYTIERYKMQNRLFNFDIKNIQISDLNCQSKNKYVFTEKGKYILGQVSKWKKSKNWYEERSILFRRGMLLNGQTGSGKSSLILEVAKTLGLPLYLIDLSSFENEEFCSSMDRLSIEPAIILFEDIDAIWDGRKNLIKTDHYIGLTFDCFLNKLSGVKAIKNKFIFITTNHLEKMDSALIRAGRIDEVIDLPCLNIEEKYKMANVILDDNKEMVNKVVKEGEFDTTAEFENRVVQECLKTHWT